MEKSWSDAVDAINADDPKKLRQMILENPALKEFRGETAREWLSGALGDRGLFHMAAFNDSSACVDFLAKEGWDMHEPWTVNVTSMDQPPEVVTPLSLALLCRKKKIRRDMFEALMGVASRSAEDEAEGWQLAMWAAGSVGDSEIMGRIRLRLGEEAHHLWASADQEKSNLFHLAAGAVDGSIAVLDMIWGWDGLAEIAEELNSDGLSPKVLAESKNNVEFAGELERRIRSCAEKWLLSDVAAEASLGSKGHGARRL